jgi:hypothetical protein
VLTNPRVSVDVGQSRRSVVTSRGQSRTRRQCPQLEGTRLRSVLDQCSGLRRRGNYELRRDTTVFGAIAMAGSLNDSAKHSGSIPRKIQ